MPENTFDEKLTLVQVMTGCCQTTSHYLTHWGRVTHICVSDLTSIGSDNGLSPGRRQAIIRTNAGILLIRPLGTNFSEFLVEILMFSFKKMRLKVSSAKRRPFCLGLNELSQCWPRYMSLYYTTRPKRLKPWCQIPLYNITETSFNRKISQWIEKIRFSNCHASVMKRL